MLSCVCMSVCTGRESIHLPYSQESMHVSGVGGGGGVCVQTHGYVNANPGVQ